MCATIDATLCGNLGPRFSPHSPANLVCFLLPDRDRFNSRYVCSHDRRAYGQVARNNSRRHLYMLAARRLGHKCFAAQSSILKLRGPVSAYDRRWDTLASNMRCGNERRAYVGIRVVYRSLVPAQRCRCDAMRARCTYEFSVIINGCACTHKTLTIVTRALASEHGR